MQGLTPSQQEILALTFGLNPKGENYLKADGSPNYTQLGVRLGVNPSKVKARLNEALQVARGIVEANLLSLQG